MSCLITHVEIGISRNQFDIAFLHGNLNQMWKCGSYRLIKNAKSFAKCGNVEGIALNFHNYSKKKQLWKCGIEIIHMGKNHQMWKCGTDSNTN